MGYNSIEEILAAKLSPDALKKALEAFTAATNKESYDSGKNDNKKSNLSGGDLSTDKSYITDITNLEKSGLALQGAAEDFKKAANPTNFEGADFLRDAAQGMAISLGLGQARMSEMKTTIADALPEMLKLGITENEALSAMTNIPKELGINTSLGKEALVEMSAAANVTGVNVGTLAKEFKGVGISLYDVGDKMAEVANYAKSVGVNVKAVSADVVNNLKQLNLFNFDSGVKGLAKMASQASMLGFDMAKTFKLADDLMSPEKAIDLAASLQRLGVSSSALLDPLKAMDLAQNDPEALQKEMINVSKEFTKLKADGSGFEILPGAKRRLREVAQAMGMSADELANMSIKSADLDMKMSKIKFPSLASSEEDKMLIANMAQMKGGEAVLQIRNDITGKMDDINVKDLTADQITKLKEQQSNENKTIEEIALDQLTALQKINNSLNAGKTAVNLGKATTPTMDRFYSVINKTQEIIATNTTQGITTENVRDAGNKVLNPLEQEVVKFFKGESDWATVTATLVQVKDGLVDIAGNIVKGAGNVGTKTVADVTNSITGIYSPLNVQPTKIVMDPSSPFATQIQSLIEQFTKGGSKETKTTADVNMNVNLVGTNLPANLTPDIKTAVVSFFDTPEGKSYLTKWMTDNNSGLMADKK
jgi:hypothetical protein